MGKNPSENEGTNCGDFSAESLHDPRNIPDLFKEAQKSDFLKD
jgi:hypothetical protein